jgi:hypothetical protein
VIDGIDARPGFRYLEDYILHEPPTINSKTASPELRSKVQNGQVRGQSLAQIRSGAAATAVLGTPQSAAALASVRSRVVIRDFRNNPYVKDKR